MGLFDSLFGGGKSKTTTKSTYDKDTTAAQQALMKGVLGGLDPYLSNSSAFVAPMNPYQTAVGTGAQNLSNYTAGYNASGSLPDYAKQYSDLGAGGDLMSRLGVMDKYVPGYSQQAIDASTIDMNDIAGFANPYASALNDSAQRNLRDAYDTTQNDIGMRAAAGGAFGGSREAVQRGMGARDYMQQAADTATQIKADSYGIGAQLAGQNAGALTAALQGAGNDVYNRALGSATYDDNLRNDAFTRQLQGLQGAAGYDLSRAGFNNTAANDFTSRNLQSLGLMSGYGTTVRDYDQQKGDAPYTQFQRLAGFIPGYQPTTTTKTPTQGGGLLGGLLALGGAL